ncbi:MAG: PAS domain S-box protein [Hyphomicrobiaceae bacterium]|nr:PAS domain S-box protein [Hyphomicrobiaceae bacterium]
MLGIADFHRTFLAEMPDGVLLADRDGVIRFWNAGCRRVFGFTADEAVGKSLDIIIPEALRARHWQGYAETIRTGQSRYGSGDLLSVPALRKDGTRISVEFSIVVFRDADRIAGIGAVMRDVTRTFHELKALKQALAASSSKSGIADPSSI